MKMNRYNCNNYMSPTITCRHTFDHNLNMYMYVWVAQLHHHANPVLLFRDPRRHRWVALKRRSAAGSYPSCNFRTRSPPPPPPPHTPAPNYQQSLSARSCMKNSAQNSKGCLKHAACCRASVYVVLLHHWIKS